MIMAPRECGFAYLILLLLIAVFEAGTALTVQSYYAAARSDAIKDRRWQGEQYRAAIARFYESDGSKSYPKSFSDLLEDRRSLVVKRHLREIYRGPAASERWVPLRTSDGGIYGVVAQDDTDEQFSFYPLP